MLTPATLLALRGGQCHRCEKTLGVYHAYPVTDPATLLNLLTEHPPHCRQCATEITEEPPLNGDLQHIAAVIIVKASGLGMPTGRLIKLHPEDKATWFIQLFTPAQIIVSHVSHRPAARAVIVRPATNEEALAWLTPAIEAASANIAPGTDEYRELLRHLASLQRHLPKPLPPSKPAS
jgi:hypothetical protein